MCVCVCVYVCAYVSMRACVRICMNKEQVTKMKRAHTYLSIYCLRSVCTVCTYACACVLVVFIYSATGGISSVSPSL